MNHSPLDPDCENCLGICCIAPSFTAGDMYAFEKHASVRCQNLADDRRCTIHDRLADDGMHGCIEYTCYGAGQRLCTRVLPGVDWLSQPDRSSDLFDTYFKLKELHEVMWFLSQMADLCPDPDLKVKIIDRISEIDELGEASDDEIRKLDVPALTQRDRVWAGLVEKAQARYRTGDN